jgi:GAF domain-containing protein
LTNFQPLMEELLERTSASRTTLRIDDEPGVEFPIKAEALAPGIGSIAGDPTLRVRVSATFQWVDRERRVLVQEDLLEADPAPAPQLVEKYGARAQMLAPVERGGEVVGLVSVHYAPGPRQWTDEEVAAVEEIVERVVRELASRNEPA